LKDVVAIAHDNGIQVLAGYEITNTGNGKSDRGRDFVKLMASNDEGKLRAHAEKVMKFIYDDTGIDFDGISFDLEINGLNESHAGAVTKFYHIMAQLLQAKGGKLLAYATGLGVDKGNKTKLKTLGSFMAQPFNIGKGHSNILVRPMAYDVNLKEADLFAWHDAISQFAVDEGLDATQFQLGVKTLGNSGGNVTNPSLVAKRAHDFLKPRGHGLVIFAMSKSTIWAKYKQYASGLND
jgi:hypothetical protein